MTTIWSVVFDEALAPDALGAHRRALSTLPARFREVTAGTDGHEGSTVGVVSVGVAGWEHRLGRLRGALITDLALLEPSDVARVVAVSEDLGVPILPDLPEAWDPAGAELQGILAKATGIRLVVGTGCSTGTGLPRATVLRGLALAQVMLLSPLLAAATLEVGPVRSEANAFTCSFQLAEIVVELSAVITLSAPQRTEVLVFGDGSMTQLAIPANPEERPSELTSVDEGEARTTLAHYSSGRREAWLHLYRALSDTGADSTRSCLDDLAAGLTLLGHLGLPAPGTIGTGDLRARD